MGIQRYDIEYQEAGQDFRLLYISHSKCENDWHSLLHSHYCAEIFYVLSGKGFFRMESQDLPLHPGDLVVVNPYTMHTELSFASNPLEYIVMGIEGVQFQAPGGAEQRLFHLQGQPQEPDYRFYPEAILRECEERQENYLEVCAGLARVFLILLRRRIAQRSLVLDETRTSLECARVKQYMDEHFQEDITLDTLAEISHMSKHYLAHAFNKEIGCSPISYLLAHRIAESKHLLENSDYTVSQISAITGFSSPSYFSQRFKKLVGKTPLEYRQAVRIHPADIPSKA